MDEKSHPSEICTPENNDPEKKIAQAKTKRG
jgi:hypothetical protein